MMEIFQNELLRVSTLRHLLLYNIFRWSIKGGYSYIIKLLLPRVYQFSLPTFLNLLFTLMQFRISTVDFDTTCPFKTKVPSYWTAKQSTSLYMMRKLVLKIEFPGMRFSPNWTNYYWSFASKSFSLKFGELTVFAFGSKPPLSRKN